MAAAVAVAVMEEAEAVAVASVTSLAFPLAIQVVMVTATEGTFPCRGGSGTPVALGTTRAMDLASVEPAVVVSVVVVVMEAMAVVMAATVVEDMEAVVVVMANKAAAESMPFSLHCQLTQTSHQMAGHLHSLSNTDAVFRQQVPSFLRIFLFNLLPSVPSVLRPLSRHALLLTLVIIFSRKTSLIPNLEIDCCENIALHQRLNCETR